MKALVVFGLAIVAVILSGALWVRFAPLRPEHWHLVPTAEASTGRPNEARLLPGEGAPVYDLPPAELAARLDALALAEPRTERLAGHPEEGFVTYVQRTPFWRFPDVVSLRVLPHGEGATLAIWSRARYGYSDWGVNAARLARWLEALKPFQKP